MSENETLYNQLKQFKNDVYNKVFDGVPPIDNTSLDSLDDDLASSIIVAYNNHLTLHFEDFIKKFVRCWF